MDRLGFILVCIPCLGGWFVVGLVEFDGSSAARSLKGDAVAILATLKGPADCRGCENPEKIWRWWDDWLRIQDLLTKQPGVSCDIKAYGSPHSASRIAINTRFA